MPSYHHYLNGTFHYAVDITLHTGWNFYHLFVPRVQITLTKYSFYFRGTKLLKSYFVLGVKTMLRAAVNLGNRDR